MNIPIELLSIEDLCSTLSIGRNTAYTLLQNGEIPAFRVGRKWKITRESLEQYISEKKNTVTKGIDTSAVSIPKIFYLPSHSNKRI